MNFLRKMWRFLDRWNTLTGYFIGGVWLLFNGNFYNNGITNIRYVYFFNTTLQVIKNYVFLQPIVHKPLG